MSNLFTFLSTRKAKSQHEQPEMTGNAAPASSKNRFSAGMLLAAALISASLNVATSQAISWADDAAQADTTWYTDNKDAAEYLISTPEQLAGLAILVNKTTGKDDAYSFAGKTIKLTQDIDLAKTIDGESVKWKPIGTYLRNKVDKPFAGTFDGQGFTIKNVDGNVSTGQSAIFGHLSGATISNIVIDATAQFSTTSSIAEVGSIYAYAKGSTISHCVNYASFEGIKNSNYYIGGIGAKAYESTVISNCVNYGDLNTSGYIGGITGLLSSSSTAVNCVNYGDLHTGSSGTGGIVGYGSTKYFVANCVNYGAINIGMSISGGGIVGSIYFGGVGNGVFNCINAGEMTSNAGKESYINPIVRASSNCYTFRNFAINTITENIKSSACTFINKEQLESASFIAEMNAYAGYLSSTNPRATGLLHEAMLTANNRISYTTAQVEGGQRIEVQQSDFATINTGFISTEEGAAYAKAGETFTIEITPNLGFNFTGISINGGEIINTNSFKVPATDISVKTFFNAGDATSWAALTQYAKEGADYTFAENCYEVYTAIGLAYVAEQINAGKTDLETKIDLMANINFGVTSAQSTSPLTWIPMGTEEAPFNGTFNGNNFTIESLYVNSSEAYVGLFGITSEAIINDIKIASSSKINSSDFYVGALAGKAINGTTITNCHNAAPVSGKGYVAGLVGMFDGEINNSSNNGAINASAGTGAGVAAILSSTSTIRNTYNAGDVYGMSLVGGIVGKMNNDGDSEIANCYNAGAIKTAGITAGGIAATGGEKNIIKNTLSYGAIKAKNGAVCLGAIVGMNNGNTKLVRNYFLDTIATGIIAKEGENMLTDTDLKSSALASEMTGFAGYMNKEMNAKEYVTWVMSTADNKYPMFNAKMTTVAYKYKMVFNEAVGGTYTLTLPKTNFFAKDFAYYFASGNPRVTIGTLTPDEGNVCRRVMMGSKVIMAEPKTGSSYLVFQIKEDVTFDVIFDTPATTWAEAANDAKPFTDYKLNGAVMEIKTATGLGYMAKLINEGATPEGVTSFALTANIDLGSKQYNEAPLAWIPVGTDKLPMNLAFNGNGHTISNMMVSATALNTGLFSYISGGTVSNLTMDASCSVASTKNQLGVIAGYALDAVIDNCTNNAAINAPSSMFVGGIVGKADGTTIVSNCTNHGAISAKGTAGGVVGLFGSIKATGRAFNCLNTADITSTNMTAGGVIGMLQGNRSASSVEAYVELINSVNTGNVKAKSMVGGVIGFVGAREVYNNINLGTVTATGVTAATFAGSVAGYLNGLKGLYVNGMKFYHNFSVEDCVTLAAGKYAADRKTELPLEALKDAALIEELSAVAGAYENEKETVMKAWTVDANGLPTLSADLAPKAYNVTYAAAEGDDAKGSVTLPAMISKDDANKYVALDGEEVALTATANEGYKLHALTANDTDITEAQTATVSGSDVVILANFTPLVSLDEVEAGSRVWAAQGKLFVSNDATASLYVSTIAGQTVLNAEVEAGQSTFTLAAGTYVVTLNGQSSMIIVQ